jgi:hypothetical protein
MTKAHQVEHATFGYDAMVAGIGGVMGHVIETVACRSFERLYDVPVFDVHMPAPGHRKPSCPKSGGRDRGVGAAPSLPTVWRRNDGTYSAGGHGGLRG